LPVSLQLDARSLGRNVLSDQDLVRLLADPHPAWEVARGRQVFVNRNLRMADVELVGFDMDYTLALYHMRQLEQLSFDLTLVKLVAERGYPPEIALLHYDHRFVMRGLAVDRVHGNLIKLDRFGHVGRAYHGLRRLDDETWRRLYLHERIRVRAPSYAWIDTLFALPEAFLFAGTIELLESCGRSVDYGKLYDDIRDAIDTVHRDGSLKREIRKEMGRFIFKDLELGPALHKLRSGGKRLFLLTNSLWDYTDAVMCHLLNEVVPEYPSWRNYFDVVVTGANKPAFFSEQQPFLELDPTSGEEVGEATELERGKVYQGGNLPALERMTGFSGQRVLYVGDHIYGDILKSKKASLWRTCMVVQELEEEIDYTSARQEEIARLAELEGLRARLDDEVSYRKGQLNALERRLERNPPSHDERARLEEERRVTKLELDTVRRALKQCSEACDALERDLEAGFNPYWGLLFKEGPENSRFGEQVEQYACIYTSRVSNLLHYSPSQYFRSPRERMPHEQAGAPSAQLSAMGSEGPAKASSST
jgi:HAD superfamily 5'-nucleotidase-like hydrolase